MAFFKRDVLGNIVFLKRILFFVVGTLTYPRFTFQNKVKVEGTENLDGLGESNVLFVSNHQTYFAEGMVFNHVVSSHKCGYKNRIGPTPFYLLNPRLTYIVAALETMKAGILPRIFEYMGSVSIKRTFREGGVDINRKVQISDISNIGKALSEGWVITFPQGTTKPFAPGRRGTSHIIKKYKPIVIPIVISGFRRAFDKKGLKLKKRGTTLKMKFKKPLDINYSEDSDVLLHQIMYAIEQSDEFKGEIK